MTLHRRARPPALDAPKAAESSTVERDDAQIVALLLRDSEAAAVVGVSRAHFRRLVATGRAPRPLKLGNASRWRVEELRRWVELGCPRADVVEGRAR
jgi:predicted DNA-binding transcriptional regulator AlpA